MRYLFWDSSGDESLGFLDLPDTPRIGDVITCGFIRNRHDTEWVVIGCCYKYDSPFYKLFMKCLIGLDDGE